MAAGFGHGDYTSRYGRRIKPTSKVKALLADSTRKVYNDACAMLKEVSSAVLNNIKNDVTSEVMVPLVDIWLNNYDEVMEAEAEYRRHIEGEEVNYHDADYENRIDRYTHIQKEMGDFIDRKKIMQGRKVKSKSLGNYQAIHRQKADLEDQMISIEKELTQLSIKREVDSFEYPQTSTPRKSKPFDTMNQDYSLNYPPPHNPNYDDEFYREEMLRIQYEEGRIPTKYEEEKRPLYPRAPLSAQQRVESFAKPVGQTEPSHIPAYVPIKNSMNPQQPLYLEPSAPREYDVIQPGRSRRLKRSSEEIQQEQVDQFDQHVPRKLPPDKPPDKTPDKGTLTRKEDSTSSPDAATAAILKLADVLTKRDDRLPEKEPGIFSGNVVEYPLWWNSFEMLVEKKTSSNSERIYYLDKYTTGEAKKAIAGFLHLFHDENAYLRAKTTLMNRFGNKRKVAEEFRLKLAKQPVVKRYDAKGLQEYADLLWQCHAAMQTMDYLSHLDMPEENIKLAHKLPYHVMEKWNNYIDKHVYNELPDNTRAEEVEENSYPCLLDFCRFVSGEARKAAGPCANKGPPEKKEYTNKRYSTSLNTKTGETTAHTNSQQKEYIITCLYCKKSHHTYKCPTFLAMTPDFKKSFASEHALCFGCLKRNHVYRVCRNRNPDLMKGNPLPTNKATTMSTHEYNAGSGRYFSTIMPLTLEHVSDPENKIEIYGILDTQSDSCYVLEEFVEELGIGSKPINLEITTMNDRVSVASSLVYGLKVRGATGVYDINLPKCYTKESIPGNLESLPTPSNVRKWKHLEQIADDLLPYKASKKIGLLIGYNCPAAMFWKNMIEDGEDKPYAMSTKLGWCVMGNLEPKESNQHEDQKEAHICCLTTAKQVDITTKEIKRVFDLDFVESRAEKMTRMSDDDYSFMNTVECSIKQKEDGHIEMDLPFDEEPQNLPNNRGMAMSKLMYLKKKLKKDEVLTSRYKKFMDNMLSLGHAEEVKGPGEKGKVWYWSHHGVYHPHKLDKLRVVFNGSEIYQGICLNDLLLAGPELINSLVGVLCKFRLNKIAFTCDVEGMFHQVQVTEKCRDYLRFLWFKDGNPDNEIVEYRMRVHLFGASSSPGCANFAFKHVADLYEKEYGKEVADFIRKQFYVDDGLKSMSSVAEVVALFMKSHSMCKKGGFNLTKFMSNNEEVLSQIPEELKATKKETYEIKEANSPLERTLGLLWNLIRDLFMFIVNIIKVAENRRQMLSQLSSIYDPLGLISPAILPGRNILQDLCKAHLKWDEIVPEEYQKVWNAWTEGLNDLKKLEIPRCIRSTTENIQEIHLLSFSDASNVGYGMATYIKVIDVAGNVDVNLYFAKSRVMPNKQVTIPRMELQAAVLASRVGAFLANELEDYNVTTQYWTDSRVVLGYLYNRKKKFQLYVANRVQVILSNSKREDWHYVETKRNPADLASRGCKASELVNNQIWWKGPSFIHEQHEYKLQPEHHTLREDDPGLKKEKPVTLNTLTKVEEYSFSKQLQTMSSWYRMIKVIAYWRRFLKSAKSKIQKNKENIIVYDSNTINVAEMYQAEHVLFKLIQKESYPDFIASTEKIKEYPELKCRSRERKSLSKYVSNLYKLDVYMDTEGVLRVGGRIKRATIPRELIHPVILPKAHPLVKLIARHYHIMTCHGGRGFTLNAIRQAGIWLTNARTAIYSYIKDCVICNELRKAPNKQTMSDLPEERLHEEAPFTYIGVDVFGPFYVKQGRALKKRWVCVFTCLTIRSIHTEVLFSLDTSSFINAYRRFIHRRGPCRMIFCDCGTNFKGARSEMEKELAAWDTDKLKREALKDKCDFVEYHFNFPKSSHMGGVWERMIRSVRNSLSYLLSIHGEQLDDELLCTLLTEAESIVNTRPLTYVDMSDPYLPPMTPMQLLTMKNTSVLPPPGEFMREDLYARKRWRRVQYLANQFWYRWRNEYTHQLQSRSKWEKEKPCLKKDDIVLIVDENLPRNRWIKGKVSELHPSKDGLIRKVTLKTMNGHLDRPIHKTVLLYRETKEIPV